MAEPLTFAEEFPHTASLGRACVRYLAGLGSAFVAMAFCRWLGSSDFLAGWISCLAFCEIKNVMKAAQQLPE
jgi:hypothetical protein